MVNEPSFDEVYSVSDLHLGGPPGFQIFDQGALLAATVRHLAGLPAERRVALVLNGDVVDFLAEDQPRYLDVATGAVKLKRIVADPAFAEVFTELGKFLDRPNSTLVIGMGNHDVELGLPEVQAALVEALCHGSAVRRGRLQLLLDGTGFAARVARAKVLIVHGNEVDTWNVVDHDALRKLVRAQNAGGPVPEWEPNAGTKLVIDVMNAVKRRYPLVDLLKPETRGVLPVLIGLDPSVLANLKHLAPLLAKLTGTALRRRMGFLGPVDEATGSEFPAEAALDALLSSRATPLTTSRQLVAAARSRIAAGEGGLDWTKLDRENGQLGFGGMVVDLMRGRKPDENLREGLEGWMASDTSFDFKAADETFETLDESIGPEVEFLVAGHTHLERSLPRTRGKGRYFNSGTWVRLVQLKANHMQPEGFTDVLKVFRDGRMAAIDASGLVVRRGTVVAIREDGGKARGELCRAKDDADGFALQPLAGSEHVVSA